MGANQLERVFYISRATRAPNQTDVRGLVAMAQARNRSLDITGVLAYTDRHFAQVLEGRHADLQPLLERIARDDRHTDVRVILCQAVKLRLFERWSMAYLHSLDLSDQIEDWLTAPMPLPHDQLIAAQAVVEQLPETLLL